MDGIVNFREQYCYDEARGPSNPHGKSRRWRYDSMEDPVIEAVILLADAPRQIEHNRIGIGDLTQEQWDSILLRRRQRREREAELEAWRQRRAEIEQRRRQQLEERKWKTMTTEQWIRRRARRRMAWL